MLEPALSGGFGELVNQVFQLDLELFFDETPLLTPAEHSSRAVKTPL